MKTKFLVAAAIIMSLAGAAPAPAQAAVTPMTVMTLNVHGSVDHNGNGNAGATKAITADVLSLISGYHPTAMVFQEMCGTQYRDLRTKLATLGYAGAYSTARASGGCNDAANDNQFGTATLFLGSVGWKSTWALPWGDNPVGSSGREARRLLCSQPSGQSWRICVIHLAPGVTADMPDNLNQATEVNRIVTPYLTSKLIIAGDFNEKPAVVAQRFPRFIDAGPNIDHIVANSTVTVGATVAVASSDHPAQFATVS